VLHLVIWFAFFMPSFHAASFLEKPCSPADAGVLGRVAHNLLIRILAPGIAFAGSQNLGLFRASTFAHT
jgi:hypothetical protein